MITLDGVRMASTEIQKGEHLVPEVEEGNREYKFKLTDLSDDQLTHRITQLNWRLNEGNDEAFYLIGVEDNGNQLGLSEEDLQESLKNLQFIADQVGCEMMVRQLYAGEQGTTAEVHMRRRERMTVEVVQVNVAVAGDLDSGKSTMIGVLCTGQLDNGKGLARTKVLTHNHEVETGLTSCISHHSLHFNGEGEVLNADPLPGMSRSKRVRALSDLELADETTRSVMLMDLAGHAKYLKTTLHGLIGRRPDHCIVCVSATTGLNSITTEHLGVCMYLNVPLIIVITKADCVGHFSHSGSNRAGVMKGKAKAKQRTNSYTGCDGVDVAVADPVKEASNSNNCSANTAISRLVESIRQVLAGPQRTAMMVSDEEQLVHLLQHSADHASSPRQSQTQENEREKTVVPIFTVSNVTGDGLPLLRSYLFQLPTHAKSRQALQQQSTCVRILGAIGTTLTTAMEDRENEGVFPRDEEVFSLKQKREVRHSSNRYALNNNQRESSTNDSSTAGAGAGERSASSSGEKAGSAGLRCHSNSEDNLTCRADAYSYALTTAAVYPSTPCKHSGAKEAGGTTTTSTCAGIRRPYSSPDLPSATADTTTPYAISAIGHCRAAMTSSSHEREFAEFVDLHIAETVDQQQQQQRSSPNTGRDTPQTARTGTSRVLIGSIDAGKVMLGEPMLFGPTSRGEFLSVVVSSLRLSNVPVRCASAGQTVTFKLTECASDADAHLFSGSLACGAGQCGRRRSSATGLVLLSPPSADATAQQQQQHVNVPSSSIITQRQQEQENQQEVPLAHWEFEAELLVLNHPAKIRVNYEPVVHVGCVKQSAKLISIRKIIIPGEGGTHSSHEEGEMSSIGGNVGEIGNDEVGNGERAVCRFRFLYYPEFIIRGEAMIIREQRTRGVGTITALL